MLPPAQSYGYAIGSSFQVFEFSYTCASALSTIILTYPPLLKPARRHIRRGMRASHSGRLEANAVLGQLDGEGKSNGLGDCEKCFSNTSEPALAKTGALKSLAPRTYQAPKYIQYSCLYPEVLPPRNKHRQTGQFCPKADHCRHPGWPSEYLSGLTNFVTPGDEKLQFLMRVKPLIDFPVLRSCPGSFYVGAIRLAPIPPAFWIYSRMSSTFIRRRQE